MLIEEREIKIETQKELLELVASEELEGLTKASVEKVKFSKWESGFLVPANPHYSGDIARDHRFLARCLDDISIFQWVLLSFESY
jgi:hypothetical protein